ncbi:MAG: DNA/RNA nuclease SfsA [Candidatus Nezhaarchaeales archaeon]
MMKLMELDRVRQAVIVERLNRFVVLVELDGELVRVHNTNTGRLHDVLVKGFRAIVTSISGRKLKYRLVGVEHRDGLYGIVDTITQEEAFRKALELSLIPYLRGYVLAKRNPRVNGVVHDYLLKRGDEYAVVEIKSAEFRGKRDEAMYPDCPTIRGRRHIINLIRLSKELNVKTYLIFLAAMPRPRCFMPFRGADPVVDELVREALRSGVEVRSIAMFMDQQGRIYLEDPDLPICNEWLKANNVQAASSS